MFNMFRSKNSESPASRRTVNGKKVERFLKLLESFARSVHLLSLSFKNAGIIIFIFLSVICGVPIEVIVENFKS